MYSSFYCFVDVSYLKILYYHWTAGFSIYGLDSYWPRSSRNSNGFEQFIYNSGHNIWNFLLLVQLQFATGNINPDF